MCKLGGNLEGHVKHSKRSKIETINVVFRSLLQEHVEDESENTAMDCFDKKNCTFLNRVSLKH